MTVKHDQFHIVNVDPDGINHPAQNLMGLGNEVEDLLRKRMITTIFIRGTSAQSKGRCSQVLAEDGPVCGDPTLCGAG